MLKRPSRPSVRGVMSPEQISAWVAPVATRWRKQRDLAAVSMAAMRGIEAKALRLGHTSEQLLASGGDAIAELARALAKGRIESGAAAPGAPVFILAGSGAESALALEAGLRIAASGTPIVVALCGTRARPEHAAASAAWDRLESLTNARRFRVPDMREAAHFRAGIEDVALVMEALGGSTDAIVPPAPTQAGIDLVIRARAAGVPCLAITAPVGLDPETGSRRRGAPGADVTITLHRPLITLLSETSRKLVGELLVAPLDLPRDADTLAQWVSPHVRSAPQRLRPSPQVLPC